jgi:hypothetical protein
MDSNLSLNTGDDLFRDRVSLYRMDEKCTDKLQGMIVHRNTVKTVY